MQETNSTPNNVKNRGNDRPKNTLGFLIATIIITICVGSVAIDTIRTKRYITRQLDLIESRLVSVDQKLDKIVYFLQSGKMIRPFEPVDPQNITTESLDSLSIEVESVQSSLNELKQHNEIFEDSIVN